jgi:subtilisin-like proprotein convertase family protein
MSLLPDGSFLFLFHCLEEKEEKEEKEEEEEEPEGAVSSGHARNKTRNSILLSERQTSVFSDVWFG